MYQKRRDSITLNGYIREKRKLLSDFMIDMTAEMQVKLEEMYPDTYRMDNYIHDIVKHHLDKF